jgi:hypothetical protein
MYFEPRTVQPAASRYTDWATRPTVTRDILEENLAKDGIRIRRPSCCSSGYAGCCEANRKLSEILHWSDWIAVKINGRLCLHDLFKANTFVINCPVFRHSKIMVALGLPPQFFLSFSVSSFVLHSSLVHFSYSSFLYFLLSFLFLTEIRLFIYLPYIFLTFKFHLSFYLSMPLC